MTEPLDPAALRQVNADTIKADLAEFGAAAVADYVVAYIEAAMQSSDEERDRLADALAAAQRDLAAEREKVQRVEALRKRYRFLGGDWSGFADDLDAALAGEGAAEPQDGSR